MAVPLSDADVASQPTHEEDTAVTLSGLTLRITGEGSMGKYTGARNGPSRDEIARLAYRFYEARGRRDGHALEDWVCAEQELTQHYR